MTSHRLLTVRLDRCDLDGNPRSTRDPAYCRALGENVRLNGQKVPLIGFFKGERFQVADGGCRVEGMRAVGLAEALALDWGKEPTPADLLMAQASIDLHKQFLPPLDRARLYRSLLAARNCTAKQLAQELGGVSDSLIGKYLSLLGLPAPLQERVNTGELDFSKACLLVQEADPTRQTELANAAAGMSRAALAGLVRKPPAPDPAAPKVTRLPIRLPGGVSVVLSGLDMNLDQAIDWLSECLKAARKAREDGLSAKSWAAGMKDKAQNL